MNWEQCLAVMSLSEYSGLRADHQKQCALVTIGVKERGEKHFLAIEEGVCESTQSWREELLGAQDGQRAELPAQERAAQGKEGLAGDLDSRRRGASE